LKLARLIQELKDVAYPKYYLHDPAAQKISDCVNAQQFLHVGTFVLDCLGDRAGDVRAVCGRLRPNL
jgi:hypothetical protein